MRRGWLAILAAGAIALALAACGDDGSRTTATSDARPAPAAPSCAGLAARGTLEMTAADEQRSAAVHISRQVAGRRRAAPVMIALHGYTGTGAELTELDGFVDAVDAAGFAAIMPDGIAGEWHFPGYRFAGVDPEGERKDRRFLAQLIDRLAALDCVDPDRIFVMGGSMGGGMATEVGCREAHRIAGIALVAAVHYAIPCPDAPPLPVISLHALNDDVLPYRGGRVGGTPEGFPRVRSIPAITAALAHRNECPPRPRAARLSAGAVRLRFTGCREPFVHLRLAHGGHAWFGMTERRSGVSAIEVVLDFFTGLAKHPDR